MRRCALNVGGARPARSYLRSLRASPQKTTMHTAKTTFSVDIFVSVICPRTGAVSVLYIDAEVRPWAARALAEMSWVTAIRAAAVSVCAPGSAKQIQIKWATHRRWSESCVEYYCHVADSGEVAASIIIVQIYEESKAKSCCSSRSVSQCVSSWLLLCLLRWLALSRVMRPHVSGCLPARDVQQILAMLLLLRAAAPPFLLGCCASV
jgi:hypothetical protein